MSSIFFLSGMPKVETMDREEYEKQKLKWANDAKGNLNETDGYNCDICHNKGVLYYLDENLEHRCKRCRCMNTRETLKRAKESGLSNILTDYTFDKYIATEGWQKNIKMSAMEFCHDDNANMFFIGGQSGSGKTHICTAIAATYIKQGYNCRYMLWRDDSTKLKQLVNDYPEYQKLINEFKKADVLYIDDLFKSQSGTEPTKGDVNAAFEIINNRINDKRKITIISSEYTITELLNFDQATIGRIYQASGKYKIGITNDIKKNYRLR